MEANLNCVEIKALMDDRRACESYVLVESDLFEK